MNFQPMWERNSEPPRLPVGVYAIYHTADEDELMHLLLFLKNYYKWNNKTLGKDLTITDAAHPLAQENQEFLTLKSLVHKMLTGGAIPELVAIGFYDTHQTLFRAYLAHLLGEMHPKFIKLKTAFQDAEDEFFPKRYLTH